MNGDKPLGIGWRHHSPMVPAAPVLPPAAPAPPPAAPVQPHLVPVAALAPFLANQPPMNPALQPAPLVGYATSSSEGADCDGKETPVESSMDWEDDLVDCTVEPTDEIERVKKLRELFQAGRSLDPSAEGEAEAHDTSLDEPQPFIEVLSPPRSPEEQRLHFTPTTLSKSLQVLVDDRYSGRLVSYAFLFGDPASPDEQGKKDAKLCSSDEKPDVKLPASGHVLAFVC